MKVKFQYTDWTEWEGPPGDAGASPDKGVVRMWGEDDFGRLVLFVYDDFYYVCDNGDGTFRVGSGTNQREFTLVPGMDGAVPQEKFKLPAGAVLRLGEQVTQAEAVAFGLIDEGGKLLSEKATVTVEVG